MPPISRFRGSSGEVVRAFLHPSIFLAVIPVLIIWILFTLYLLFIGQHLSDKINFVLGYILALGILARYTLGARQGDVHRGFFTLQAQNIDVLHFVGRYTVLTLIWGIPIGLSFHFLSGGMQNGLFFGLSGIARFNNESGSLVGIALTILSVITIILPLITILIATATKDYRELFSLAPWRWIFQERSQDLLAYLSSVIGGVGAFWLLYTIPIVIFDGLAFKISSNLGAAVSGFALALPWICAPVLLGHLASAFVLDANEMDDDKLPIAARQQPTKSPTPKAPPSAQKQTPPPSYISEQSLSAMQIKIAEQTDETRRVALTHCLAHLKYQPLDAFAATEYALMLSANKDQEESIEAANHALTLTLQNGQTELALGLYCEFIAVRNQFKLNTNLMEKLSAILMQRDLLLDAAWCFYTIIAMHQPSQIEMYQQHMFDLAAMAHAAGKTQEARVLCQFYLKKFPASNLTETVTQFLQST